MGSISRVLISLVPQVRASSLDVRSHNTRSSGANLDLTGLGRKTGADRFGSARPPTPSHFSFSRLGTSSAARPLSLDVIPSFTILWKYNGYL